MNRATSILWATSVALVLSAGPVFAGKKVVTFPKKVFHAELQAQLDAQTVAVTNNTVPEQAISDRAGNNVVKFKPKAVAKVPKSTIARGVSRLAKLNPTRVIATTALSLLIASIPGAEWDGYKARKKISEGTPIPITQYGWVAGNFCEGQKFTSIQALTDCAIAQRQETVGPYGYTVKLDHVETISPTYMRVWLGQTDNNSGSYTAYNWAAATQQGTCQPPAYVAGDACLTGGATYRDLTDDEFDVMGNAFFGLDDAKMKSAYQELIAINPELGMYMPDYLTAPDGSFVQHMASPLKTTAIARVNPDGSIERLTRKEWADFQLNYSNASPEIAYTVTNNSQVLNEAGEKVEEETQTEQDEEAMPELSPALDSANDPLKDWKDNIEAGPTSLTAGIGYPLLFTYGGTCQPLTLTLAVYGTYTLTAICDGINTYVKPFLFVLFASWTVFHLFHIWRETTLSVRAA